MVPIFRRWWVSSWCLVCVLPAWSGCQKHVADPPELGPTTSTDGHFMAATDGAATDLDATDGEATDLAATAVDDDALDR